MDRRRLGLLIAMSFGVYLGGFLVGASGTAHAGVAVALVELAASGLGQANDPEDDEFDRILEELGAEGQRAAPEADRKPQRAPAAADEPTPRGARRRARQPRREPRGRDARSIFDDLGLSLEARQEEAKELTRQARQAMQELDLVRAEGFLDRARRLDPQNAEADRLYSEVQLLLGNSTDATGEVFRNIVDQQKVQVEQARAEVKRSINDALRHEDADNYAMAVESYERALEGIRHYPFDLDLGSLRQEAETRLAQAREQQRKQELGETERFTEMVRSNALATHSQDTRYLENQIRALRRKAAEAQRNGRFDHAVTLYERILVINPRDDMARKNLHFAKEQRHLHRKQRLLESAIHTYKIAIVSLEESSVVYQKIFRYPDRKEWLRISPKVVSIEEEIQASQTEQEKEIQAALKQSFVLNFEDVPVPDVLDNLSQISGVNFILTKDGAEAVEDVTFTFPTVTELPLEDYLDLVLQSIGGEDSEFAWTIKEGAIVVGPTSSLRQKQYLRFYEISDLVQSHPDFKAPPIALDELAGRSASQAALSFDVGGEEETGTTLGPEKLLELLEKELFAGEDDEEAVAIHGGKLSALLTLDKHLKLSRLLDQFRKSTGMMVTVESRFLDIQDNFLEQIGIDFGSTGNTFLPNSIPDIDGAGKSVSPGFEYVNNEGDFNNRVASITTFSQPLGSRVNPFNMSASGGGAYQLNVLEVEKYQLEALLTAVAKDQEVRRLNSPRVTAQNGQSAHTLVVNQSAYIQDLEVNQTGVIPVINPVIGVLNDGSILEVRPTISHDRKYVVLEVQPTLAEQLDPDVAVLNLSGNFTVVPVELPVLAVTKIKTTVTVPDGGTVLVGGLKREITQKQSVGVPGLLEVPFLNYLFGQQGRSTLRSNLFVLLNAKITIVHEEEARLFGT